MARKKQDLDPEHDYSLAPKMSASSGAPWNLCTTSGAVLALSPSPEAACMTASAIWGDIGLEANGQHFDVIVDGSVRGRIVKTKRR